MCVYTTAPGWDQGLWKGGDQVLDCKQQAKNANIAQWNSSYILHGIPLSTILRYLYFTSVFAIIKGWK